MFQISQNELSLGLKNIFPSLTIQKLFYQATDMVNIVWHFWVGDECYLYENIQQSDVILDKLTIKIKKSITKDSRYLTTGVVAQTPSSQMIDYGI